MLVDDATAHRAPTLEQLQTWNSTRAADVRAQIVAAAGAKGVSEQRAMSEDALRKRREREERRGAQARAKALADNDEEPVSAPAVSTPDRAATPTTDLSGTWTVTVPASSTAELSWYSSAGAAYATLDDARAAGVWAYPSNSTERAKCGIFRALWERGCYMGGGIKFGGDFLVYPGTPSTLVVRRCTVLRRSTGDPLRYHSHFVASVFDSPKAALRPMELVAHGRLGTATKKSHLLCAWDEDKEEASFYSIEWAGFG